MFWGYAIFRAPRQNDWGWDCTCREARANTQNEILVFAEKRSYNRTILNIPLKSRTYDVPKLYNVPWFFGTFKNCIPFLGIFAGLRR